ncbi:pilus assembly protein TadG-related protein [Alcanivorax sp. 24]|uniref:pilus assembly protein TadG-related protein n=1 Tax=Alcanivorax sp. 24 TaxID=2545266 RepID=UPI001414E42D|nr:pilus assembly protein TadG-related protein [Alcanivorax sp. 24]
MKRQGGVLMLTTPLIILLMMIFSTLALDGARLYLARQEMQSISNASATAAANRVKSCGGMYVDLDTIRDTAWKTAAELGEKNAAGHISVDLGVVERGPDKNLLFRESDLATESNAARVVYSKSSDDIGLIFPALYSSFKMETVSVAKKEVMATISATGSTAIIGGSDENAGLLGTLLGGLLREDGFSLDPTSVKSLANATFLLGDFLDSVGVDEVLGNVDKSLGVDQILRGILEGLDPLSDAARVIENICGSDECNSPALVDTNLKLSEVIKLLSDVQYPEETRVPVYDTVVALALNLVSGVDGITRDVELSVAGLVGVDLKLWIDTPPSVVVGPARTDGDGQPLVQFEAADVTLALHVSSNLLEIAKLDIPLLVRTGGGVGTLEAADCAAGSSNDVSFHLKLFPRVASVSTAILHEDGTRVVQGISATLLEIEGLNKILPSLKVEAKIEDLDIGSSGAEGGQLKTVNEYSLNQQGVATIYAGADEPLSIINSEITSDEVLTIEFGKNCSGLLGCLIGSVTQLVADLVSGLTNSLLKSAVLGILGDVLNGLLKPILDSLGLHLGGMEVSVIGANQGSVVLLDCGKAICQ